MAYTLLIADDDAMIRKGLSSLMPWAELGFCLDGVFEDGKALLQKLEAQPADVVLTDIRMHEVSGLKVAQMVFERRLPTRVVILSGYQEFEYAQQAVRYGVKEYLLKPVSLDLLRAAFERIRAELDREKSERARHDQLQNRAESLAENLDALFLNDAYAGALAQAARFDERVRLNGWGEDDVARASLLTEIACPSGTADMVENAMGLMVEDCAFHTFRKRENLLEGLLIEKRRGAAKTHLDAEQLKANLATMTGLAVRINYLSRFDHLRQLCQLKRTPPPVAGDGPVAKARAYIRAHYAEDLTLNDVAARIYVNPVYLSRVFHEKTGLTFTEAITRIRLDAARQYLREGDTPISEIARACGYPNTKYFYKQFKRYVGVSPGEWRAAGAQKELPHDGSRPEK